jgi:predicted nucleotidyltransferase component of viral defense system
MPEQKKILNLLIENPTFIKLFYLSGGTALSEYYLHHRQSEDLDFFSEQEIDKIWLTSIAKNIKKSVGFNKVDIQESFNRNLVFFSKKNNILKSEFTYYPFIQIEIPSLRNGIKVDSLIDIAVNKFFTIYQQPTARHFIDLYMILQNNKGLTWEKLKKLARIKFETVIDPIQLGSQLIKVKTVQDVPKMIIPVSQDLWRNYFIIQAKLLKKEVEK